MKNTLIFNLNSFNCDCLSLVNDGSNAIEIQAGKDDLSNPKIHFNLIGGGFAETDILAVNDNAIKYTIPAAYYSASGILEFYIFDGSYQSEIVSIAGAANDNNYSLTVTMTSDTSFSCKVTAPQTSGDFGNEWKEAIIANTSARHIHINKPILDELEDAITNTEIEALLSE